MAQLAIDIGGTTTRVAVFAAPANLTPLATFPTHTEYVAQVARLSQLLSDYRAHTPIDGVGVSLGGRIARDGQSVAVAPNLPHYEGQPLAHHLTEAAGAPVRLAHDAVCGLVAEVQQGSLAHSDRCAYLTVSTGTGCALALGSGTPAVLLSIEFAHQLIEGNTRQCLCGQIGCLETYTGGKQLAIRYGRPVETIDDLAFWAEFAAKLAHGLVNLAQLTRVEVVALSGGIALNRPTLLAETQRQVTARLRGTSLRLVPAHHGERAPLLGAALLTSLPTDAILH